MDWQVVLDWTSVIIAWGAVLGAMGWFVWNSGKGEP